MPNIYDWHLSQITRWFVTHMNWKYWKYSLNCYCFLDRWSLLCFIEQLNIRFVYYKSWQKNKVVDMHLCFNSCIHEFNKIVNLEINSEALKWKMRMNKTKGYFSDEPRWTGRFLTTSNILYSLANILDTVSWNPDYIFYFLLFQLRSSHLVILCPVYIFILLNNSIHSHMLK